MASVVAACKGWEDGLRAQQAWENRGQLGSGKGGLNTPLGYNRTQYKAPLSGIAMRLFQESP